MLVGPQGARVQGGGLHLGAVEPARRPQQA
ncbi:Bursicon Receptor [Frankliniella occidentalis]|nr:Bursicon Receptor [Frankliniella occidentalis]